MGNTVFWYLYIWTLPSLVAYGLSSGFLLDTILYPFAFFAQAFFFCFTEYGECKLLLSLSCRIKCRRRWQVLFRRRFSPERCICNGPVDQSESVMLHTREDLSRCRENVIVLDVAVREVPHKQVNQSCT